MSRTLGQVLRMVGLLIELAGILALVLWGQATEGGNAPGGLSPRGAWVVVGVGFVLWLGGTILTYWPRPRPSLSSSAETERRSERLL